MTLQLGAVFGKLGGDDVEVTPVEATVSGNKSKKLLHTVTVGEGETLLVAIAGSGTLADSWGTFPDISIGNVKVNQPDQDHIGVVSIIDTTSDITFHSSANGTSTFTAHVYTVKL